MPPSSQDAVPSAKRIASVPLRAEIFEIALNGIASRMSPPRNCRTSVSSRALPFAVLPLTRAVTSASLPIARLLQQHCAASRRKPLDRVTQRRPRDRGPVRAQIAFEPNHVGLASLAQRPADGLLNQILTIRVQPARDLVHHIQRFAASRARNEADDRRTPHP